MADYHISDIYQGGFSAVDPEKYGTLFTGYRAPVSTLGITTDSRTANVLKEFSDKLATGQNVVELSMIDLQAPIETVPKDHLKEINRLAKLTGAEPTIHGPITDASGLTEQGFNEQQREVIERRLLQAVERSHDANPDGNIPVTFHTTARLPGAVPRKEGKEVIIESIPIVNQETGQIAQVKRDERYYPHSVEKEGKVVPIGEKTFMEVKEKLMNQNETEWDNSLQQLIIPKEHADRIINETYPFVLDIERKMQTGELKELTNTQQQMVSRFRNAQEQIHDIHKHLGSLFDRAYKYSDEDNRKYLKNAAKEFEEKLKEAETPAEQSLAMNNLMEILRTEKNSKFHAPEIYKPAEEYALDKTGQSYGNVAFNAWKKFGYNKSKDTTPLVLIENPPAGGGLSTGEDLKNVIQKARDVFVENAKKEGISESKAKESAKKLIGATWDVGHINQMRQFGFTSEDIIKEAGKIAPMLKHIHLSDNFGTQNIEMPMGMGNVDLKEVMQELKEKGGKPEEAKKIIEAFHWWQFFSQQSGSPVGPSLEALGSPIYSMHMGPYWNQRDALTQGYLGGSYDTRWLPQVNYETMGAGFSQLPRELGGQRQGGQGGRMSGTPME